MKKQITLSAIITLFFISGLQAQVTQEWVQRYSGPGNGNENARKVVTDNSGNIYVGGSSAEAGVGSDDFLLLKYNSSGVLQWERKYIGSEGTQDFLYDLGIDNAGNIYVTGATYTGPSLADQCVTIKYNSNGDSLWVRKFAGYGTANFVTPSGDVYVTAPLAMYNTNGDLQWRVDTTGGFDVTADILGNVYFPTIRSHSGDEGYNCITKKLNSSGIQQWEAAFIVDVNQLAYANSIAVDASGNVCITGGSGTTKSSDLRDILTIKYNSSGVQQWANLYPGNAAASANGNAIKIDNSGNVYVAGTTGFVHGMVTVKYNSSGSFLWNYTSNVGSTAYDLVLDASNNVYVTGRYYASVWQFTTEKYNSSGNLQWSTQYGQAASCDAQSLALDASNNVYVTGITYENGHQNFLTIKYSQTTGISQIINSNPDKFSLSQNYPNPFNPVTHLEFGIPDLEFVSLKVYDILGNEVATLVNEKLNAGSYDVEFDGSILSSAVYFYKLQAGKFVETKCMTLVK